MPERNRFWDGRTVHFAHGGLGKIYDSRSFELALTEAAARKLALALSKYKQTYFSTEPEVEEILNALNYVLVGDPDSRAKHQRMETGKGMTPDGGHKPPQPSPSPPRDTPQHLPGWGNMYPEVYCGDFDHCPPQGKRQPRLGGPGINQPNPNLGTSGGC